MSNETTAAPVDGGEEIGAPAAVAFEGDGLRGWAEALVGRARSEGVALTGEGGLLTSMFGKSCRPGSRSRWPSISGYGPHERDRPRARELP